LGNVSRLILTERTRIKWFFKEIVAVEFEEQAKQFYEGVLETLFEFGDVAAPELEVQTVDIALNAGIPEREELADLYARLPHILDPISSFPSVELFDIGLQVGLVSDVLLQQV